MELIPWTVKACHNHSVDPTWVEFEVTAGCILDAVKLAEKEVAAGIAKGELEADCFIMGVTFE
jgi:hypothetical protein